MNPSLLNQPVTLTATLTGNFAAPSGQVSFLDGSVVIGTASLAPTGSGLTSTATVTTSTLSVGSHPISVSYAATQNSSAAKSSALNQVVKAPTTTILVSSGNPSTVGTPVTFTATVSTGSSALVPTGTVTFLDGATVLCTGTLNPSGVVTFSTSSLALGSHSITAAASGDSATAPSVSAALLQVIEEASAKNFTITVTPTPVTVGVGSTAILTVTVNSLNGFTEPVSLSCSGLPVEMTCNFSTATVSATGGTTTLLLGATAPHACGGTEPYFIGSSSGGPHHLPLSPPVMGGLLTLFFVGRRRRRGILLAVIAVVSALQLTGCGTCTDLGTRPGIYTINVIGTATGTISETASQSVGLTVKI